MAKKFSILITATEKVDDGYANIYYLINRYYTNDGASHFSLMDVYDNEIYNWIYADGTNQYSKIVMFFSMSDADRFWTDHKLNIDGLSDIIEDVETVKVISLDIDSYVVEDDLPQLRAQLGKKSDESVKNREEYTLDIIIGISSPEYDNKQVFHFTPYYQPVYQKPEDTGAAYFALRLIDMAHDNIDPDVTPAKFYSESRLKEYFIARGRELKFIVNEAIKYSKNIYGMRYNTSDLDKLNSSVDIRIVRNSTYTDQTFKNLILS